MKKILNSVLLISLIFFSIIGYLNYCYSQGYNIIEENKPVSILKSESKRELTNDEYVNELVNISEQNNVDLIYLIQSTEGNKPLLNYYMTSTSLKTDEKGYLNYPDVFNRTKINSFKNISKYQLDQIQLFVQGTEENINNFIENLNSNDIQAYEIVNPDYLYYSFFSMNLIKVIIILYGVMFFIFLFYQITKAKKLMLRKLNGYSLGNSLMEDLIIFNKNLLKIILLIFVITAFLFIIDIKDYLFYLKYLILLNIKLIILYNIFYITTFLLIYSSVKISSLKNNIMGKKYFKLVYVFKFGLLIVLMVSLVSLPKDINSYQKALTDYNEVSDIYNYSYIPTYSTTLVEDETLDRSINDSISKNLKDFYYLTVNELSGVVGAFTFVEPITKEELQQLREETQDPSAEFPFSRDKDYGYVNGNYLKLNKIYDESGQLVEESDLPEDKLTFLVPNKYKSDKELYNYIEDESKLYCQKPSQGLEVEYYPKCNIESNIVFTKSNSKYNLIPQEIYEEKYIIDPIITVITQDTKEQMDSFYGLADAFSYIISSGGYVVETNKQDPYSVVEPYIKEAGLENTIRETPLLSNYQLERLIQLRNKLALNFLTIIFLLFGIIGTIYYLIKTSILLNNKKYGLQLINGESMLKILKREYSVTVIFYTVLLIILLLLNQVNDWIVLGGAFKIDGIKGISGFSISILFIIIIFELVIYRVIFKRDIVNRLKENIKGDN